MKFLDEVGQIFHKKKYLHLPFLSHLDNKNVCVVNKTLFIDAALIIQQKMKQFNNTIKF